MNRHHLRAVVQRRPQSNAVQVFQVPSLSCLRVFRIALNRLFAQYHTVTVSVIIYFSWTTAHLLFVFIIFYQTPPLHTTCPLLRSSTCQLVYLFRFVHFVQFRNYFLSFRHHFVPFRDRFVPVRAGTSTATFKSGATRTGCAAWVSPTRSTSTTSR